MEFVCRIGTPDGEVIERRHEAPNDRDLRRELEKQGYHVFDIRRRGVDMGRLQLGRGRKVSPRRFLVFNQELAALLRAGLPLLQALDMMLERLEDPAFRPILSDVRDRVRSGEDLSDAFASYGDAFPRLYAPTLKAGERSGEIESVIRRFVRYQQLVIEARRRTISALVYPAVLVGLSIAMVMVLTFFVVPRFSVFFEDLDNDLPMVTRVVLWISGFAKQEVLFIANGWWVLIGIAVTVIALRLWSRTPRGSVWMDRAKIKMPLLGDALNRSALSEFCRSLSTLLNGGMPLVPALEISVGAVSNASIRGALAPRIQNVREGRPFYAALEESEAFPAMSIDMIKVGESTGSLEEMLSNVSDLFDEQVETRMQRMLTLVEPVMLIFMGLVVATLLISIYVPLFSAFGTVS